MSNSGPSLRDTLVQLDLDGNAACVGYDLCMKACPVVEDDLPIAELNAASDEPSAMTDRVRQFVIDCVQCGRCTEACPTGAPRDHMMLKLRADMPDRPGRYASYARLRGAHGQQPWHLDLARAAFQQYAKGNVDERVWPHLDKEDFAENDTLMYFGCYAFSETGSPGVTLDLADEMGIDYEVLAGLQTCCGWPQYLSGDTERAEVLLDALAQQIEKSNPKVVVSGCAECVAAVQVLSRRSGGAYESISTVEWLRRNSDKLSLQESDVPITFHDSCHLSRKMNRGHVAREVIEGTFSLTEMDESGRDGACCGYYGFGLNEEKTHDLRRRRLDQAQATGAAVMAVECVTCQESFEKAHGEDDVQVVELQRLVLDAHRRGQLAATSSEGNS
jgi:heterodisulfide reductase subunit D